MLLPQLLQITVMLLTPTLPCKNASSLILYSRNTGIDKSQAQSRHVEISCVTYYFWEKIIFSFACILVQRLSHGTTEVRHYTI